MRVKYAAAAAAILLSTFAAPSFAQGTDASAEKLNNRRPFFIAGFGLSDLEPAGSNWSHAYAVTALGNGRGVGTVRVELVINSPEGTTDIEYTSEVDCVEIDFDTGEAWIGGTIVDTNLPELMNAPVIDYALDGGEGGLDRHGDFLPDPGSGITCLDRPAPFFPDAVTRGDIFFFKKAWKGPGDD